MVIGLIPEVAKGFRDHTGELCILRERRGCGKGKGVRRCVDMHKCL